MGVTDDGISREDREKPLRRAIVRILNRARKDIGTGFFVTDDLVATCAHVIRNALLVNGQVAPIRGGERVELLPSGDLPEGHEPIAATVEHELFRDEDAEDVAFLRLEPGDRERLQKLSGEVRPLALATSQGLEGLTLRGWAFPEGRPRGHWMTAELDGPLDDPRQGRRFQLSSWKIWPGCSGGPFWDEQGRVVGMAVSVLERHPDTAFVIAAEVLAEACGELRIEHVDRGKTPTQILRGQISQRFAEVLACGELTTDVSMEISKDLKRLLGPRGKWLETTGCRLASIDVEDDDREDLRLPLELLRPLRGAEPVLVRCALAMTETAPEGPRSYPEGGRIVLATADAGGPVPDEALGQALHEVCRTGLHLASGSEHDRKRGAFDPELDHLPRISRAVLREALGPRDGRPGAAVLQLVCHVREQGLCLHDDDSGQEVVVGAEALAAVLGPFVSYLRLVVLVPVAEGTEGDPGRTLVDVAMALHRRGLAAVVAPRVPLPAAASTELTTALFGALLGDAEVAPKSLELALVGANGKLSTRDRLAHLGLRLWARAADGDDTRPLVIRPYRGLLSFEPEHARFYLGRKSKTTDVVQRLAKLGADRQPRLVLLVGASGVGKSSLAKAGVVPALAKQGWATIFTRPALHTGEQLEALVQAQAGERLVVVDQLEEVVLTETDSHDEAGRYLQRLWGLASNDGVAVVATLRVDALDRGAEIRIDAEGGRTLAQLVPGPHAVFVHHLDGDALREVITKPARDVGLELDLGLVDRLCNEALAEPGALPMLELVLDELWSRREGRRMVATEYEGGLAKRLADYADERVAELPEAQREQAKRILVRIATGPIVELATWRRRSTVDALRPSREERRESFDAALAALVEARLVVRGDPRRLGSKEEGAEHVAHAVESIELAHELLLRRWDALGRWIEEAAPRLPAIRKLELWVADRRDHETTLLTSEQLAYIEQAKLTTDCDDLSEPMVDLITVSHRAMRERRRRSFTLFAMTVVAAVGFGFVALIAWQQSIHSERASRSSRNLAAALEEKKNEAESRLRIEQGTRASLLARLQGHGAEALPLALAAVGADDVLSDDLPQEIRQGLADAMRVTARHVTLRPKGNRLRGIAVSEDGHRFASIDARGNISVFDSSSQDPIFETTAQGALGELAISSQGDTLATVTANAKRDEDFAIQIWRTDGEQDRRIEKHTKRFREYAPQAHIDLTPDGSSVIAFADDCSIWIGSTATGRTLEHIEHEGIDCMRPPQMMVTHVDEQRLSIISLGERMWTWRGSTGELQKLPSIHEAPVGSISCTNAHLCATGDVGGLISIWNPLTMEVINRIDSGGRSVSSVTLSSSGHRLASITTDSANAFLYHTTLWDPYTGTKIFSESGGTILSRIFFRLGGSRLLVQQGANVNIRDGTTGSLIASYADGDRRSQASRAIPSEHQFLVSDEAGDAIIRGMWSGELAFLIPGSAKAIAPPSFLADGKIIVALPDRIEVWTTQPLQPVRSTSGIAKFIDDPVDGDRVDAPNAILAVFGSTALFLDRYTATKSFRSIPLGECNTYRNQVISTSAIVYSEDGSRIAALCNGSSLTIWDTRDGQRIFEHDANVNQEADPIVQLSRDGELALTYSASVMFGQLKHSYQIWNVDEQELILEEHDLGGGIANPVLLPTRNEFLLSRRVETFRSGPVEIWDLESGQRTGYLPLTQKHTSALQPSPTGDTILFSQSSNLYLHDPSRRSPKLLSTESYHSFGRQAFSKSGDHLAVAEDSSIAIWDPKQQIMTSRLIVPSSTSQRHPSEVVFSGDEQRIFAIVADDRFGVWYKNGKRRCFVDAHGSELWALGASFEGDRAVTGTRAGEVVLWDTNSCTRIVVLAKLDGAITDVRFAADDDHVMIRGGKGVMQLWNVDPRAWRAMGCSALEADDPVAGC